MTLKGSVTPDVQVYIAGPMRGYANLNRELFNKIEALVPRVFGPHFKPWNPARHDCALGDNATIEQYLAVDFPAVCNSQWILLLPNWRKSEGGMKELCLAAWSGKVIAEIKEVVDEGFTYEILKFEQFKGLYEAIREALNPTQPEVKAQPPEPAQDKQHSMVKVNTVCEPAESHSLVETKKVNQPVFKDLNVLGARSTHAQDFPPGEEVVRTDPVTGGKKGYKMARFDLIPPRPHWMLALVYGFGATRREDNNWAKGYPYSGSIGALERHLQEYKGGYFLDHESKLPNLMHAAWHCYTLTEFHLAGLGTDDRLFRFIEERAKEMNDGKK